LRPSRGWRPAGLGALAGLGSLALIVLVLGPFLDRVPLDVLQLVIGVLLLLFGMRWLSKAILRAAEIIPLHDEAFAFAAGTAELRSHEARLAGSPDWRASRPCSSEGLEVAFIVIAVGAGRGLLVPASLGALAACALVAAAGFVVRRPLARVPENTLKFAVGVMLSAFGVFWTGEGLGVPCRAKTSPSSDSRRCSLSRRSRQSQSCAALRRRLCRDSAHERPARAVRTVLRRWLARAGDPRRRFARGGGCGVRAGLPARRGRRAVVRLPRCALRQRGREGAPLTAGEHHAPRCR